MCILARNSLSICLLAALGACAVGPNFKRPAAPAVQSYTGVDPGPTGTAHGVAQRFAAAAAVDPEWWRAFHAPRLNALIEAAIASNQGLAGASARLAQSEDSLRAGAGVFYPSLSGDFLAQRQRQTPLRLGAEGAARTFSLFTLSASVSYVLDIFGGERRAVENLAAQRDQQEALTQATLLTLEANIVNTTVAAASYQAEIAATEQLIALQRQQVDLARVQERAGTAAYAAVLTLETQLASVQANIPLLQQGLAQAQDALALLTGQTPGMPRLSLPNLADIAVPADLPLSLPSSLVRQRPDILAAEAAAHAASAQVGVATAAILPSLTLNANYGANGLQGQTLFASAGRAWAISADLATPLFEGGTLWFRRRAARDAYLAAMADYRQTVLAAFAQVADTLRASQHDADRLAAEDLAVQTATEALHLTQANYTAGLAGDLDLLAANAQYQQAKIADLEAQAARLQDSAALFAALGGGWRHA